MWMKKYVNNKMMEEHSEYFNKSKLSLLLFRKVSRHLGRCYVIMLNNWPRDTVTWNFVINVIQMSSNTPRWISKMMSRVWGPKNQWSMYIIWLRPCCQKRTTISQLARGACLKCKCTSQLITDLIWIVGHLKVPGAGVGLISILNRHRNKICARAWTRWTTACRL